jgi:hypothetical protein
MVLSRELYFSGYHFHAPLFHLPVLQESGDYTPSFMQDALAELQISDGQDPESLQIIKDVALEMYVGEQPLVLTKRYR